MLVFAVSWRQFNVVQDKLQDLLGEAHQTVVIQDQALEALKLTDRRRDVAQLVTAGNIERKSAYQCTMMLHNWCSGETFEVRDLNYTLRTR